MNVDHRVGLEKSPSLSTVSSTHEQQNVKVANDEHPAEQQTFSNNENVGFSDHDCALLFGPFDPNMPALLDFLEQPSDDRSASLETTQGLGIDFDYKPSAEDIHNELLVLSQAHQQDVERSLPPLSISHSQNTLGDGLEEQADAPGTSSIGVMMGSEKSSSRQTDQQMAEIQSRFEASQGAQRTRSISSFLRTVRQEEDDDLIRLANSPDATMPKTGVQQSQYQKDIYLAWRDCRTAANFKEGLPLKKQPVAYQRMAKMSGETEEILQKNSWRLLSNMVHFQIQQEKLIEDSEAMGSVLKLSNGRTFGDRLELALSGMRRQKDICKNMLDDAFIVRFAQGPAEITRRTETNKKGNEAKGAFIKAGQKAVKRKRDDEKMEEDEEMALDGEATPDPEPLSKRPRTKVKTELSPTIQNLPPLSSKPHVARAQRALQARQPQTQEFSQQSRLQHSPESYLGHTQGIVPKEQHAVDHLKRSPVAASPPSHVSPLCAAVGQLASSPISSDATISLRGQSQSSSITPAPYMVPGADGITFSPHGVRVKFSPTSIKFWFQNDLSTGTNSSRRSDLELLARSKVSPAHEFPIDDDSSIFLQNGQIVSTRSFTKKDDQRTKSFQNLLDPGNWDQGMETLYRNWLSTHESQSSGRSSNEPASSPTPAPLARVNVHSGSVTEPLLNISLPPTPSVVAQPATPLERAPQPPQRKVRTSLQLSSGWEVGFSPAQVNFKKIGARTFSVQREHVWLFTNSIHDPSTPFKMSEDSRLVLQNGALSGDEAGLTDVNAQQAMVDIKRLQALGWGLREWNYYDAYLEKNAK
ncbi:MAG: hypothetical protein M1814_003419 [Vezdaea aestivalis]|nr:MAG: hypothetical protein M1814_003419 [Vezdaea aestivalis]